MANTVVENVGEVLRDASGAAESDVCAWCRGPIPAAARRDALCCSVRCRQARHRFTQGVGVVTGVSSGTPLRLAYADPPYPGKSRRYYGDHPDFAGEVDHLELIAWLSEYDGWALSTSAAALPTVLASCPPGVRVAAWFRGSRHSRHAVRPQNAWEPVIYCGGRAVSEASTTDALVYAARPRTTDPHRVIGAKPATFCRWVFDLLGAQPADTLDDLFPGSGVATRAWSVYASDLAGTTRRLEAS